MLGRRRYFRETLRRTRQPGVATGLAWTPVGGEVLFVEATAFPGAGKMQITGQLGDVMKESAAAAFSWVKGNIDAPDDWFSTHDVHVHVPAGAIPKDGPSAGVAMATALTSLITGRVVRSDTAMTGEITLVGQVLPIGGLKEKALAAQQAGIKRVVAPALNEPDIDDIPEHLRKKIEFIFVDDINKALAQTLEEDGSRNGRPGNKRPSSAARSRKKPAGSRR
jgi:ATP-dependent Lon protease